MTATTNGTRLERIAVGAEEAGERVDRLLARRLGIPRALAQRLLAEGAVRIGAEVPPRSRRVRAGEEIVVEWAGPGIVPTPLPIPILYEDEDLVVVNKPRGLKVHPVGSAPEATVVSALLARGPLAPGEPGRPGVVHRLDAATTGALVLAKTPRARDSLLGQFRRREVKKEYLALVQGDLDVAEGAIEGSLGRDRRHPWRVAVGGRKDAATEFTVLARGEGRSLLLVRPRTGRTHQIRVHLSAIGHPVVGDPLYGGGPGVLHLHAWRLGLRHPATGAWAEWEAEPPPEFAPWLGGQGSTGQR
ncbi:MAG: RluA family pseudouridine synthase [Candidatus Bipolaricaulota bacterium]|nr:RluA family pseudouridine synthase [Candidatus Bipolaricaulota bacterium]